MRTLVLQFDSRGAVPYPELISQNLKFAELSGYEYVFLQESEETMPPYWAKVFACRESCNRNKSDAILFLDTDAVVMDFGFRTESVIPPDGEAYFAANSGGDGINAGIFAVTCDRRGRSLLDAWCGLYSPAAWRREDGEWKCDGDWAGPMYEQGAFNERLLPEMGVDAARPDSSVFLHCDHVSAKNEGTPITKERLLGEYAEFASLMERSQVVHFCGHFKSLIPIRHKLREGTVVLYDGSANDEEGAMKAAAKEWADRRR